MCNEASDIVIVYKDSINVEDPHGYFSDFRRSVLNFNSPTKRSFLNECIRQIYILNGDAMPTIPITSVFNRYHILSTLNVLMEPPKVSHYQQKVERVKRRLFRDPKLRRRKRNEVFRNILPETECAHYKPQRPVLGIKKIRRKYMDEVRNQIDAEERQKLKRKYMHDDRHANSSLHVLNTQQSVYDAVSQQVINKVCRYHGNMARHHPQRQDRSMEEQMKRERNTEACRISRRAKKLEQVLVEQQYQERLMANEKALEASIRSILYMKALMGIMVSGTLPEGNSFYA